jgi:hypothetical protein
MQVGGVLLHGVHVERGDRHGADAGDQVALDYRPVPVDGALLEPLGLRVGGEPLAGELDEGGFGGAP